MIGTISTDALVKTMTIHEKKDFLLLLLSPETLVFSCMTMTETHGKNKDKDREDNDKDEITKGLNMCHIFKYDMI